jgi:malate dehydrogenase
MAEAIIKNKKRILPCAAYCEGEYGIDGMFVGVPAVLGSNGVERIIQIDLDANEQELMNESASHVADLVNTVKTTFPELA